MSDVKEKFLDAVDELKEQAKVLLRDFKEQTVYFKAKAGVIAGYIVVVLLSIIVIPPPGEKNPIDARVKVSAIDFGSKQKTFVMIANEGGKMWDPATVTITGTVVPQEGKKAGQTVRGTWSLKERFRRGEKKELFPEKFRDANGLPAEIDIKIEEVVVEVDGEKYIKVNKKPAG